MKAIHNSRISLWCKHTREKSHWTTMEVCDRLRCPSRGMCSEYRRLNKAIYGLGKSAEEALDELERSNTLDSAAHARIATAYKTGGAASGRNQVRLELRRQQNRASFSPSKPTVNRTAAPPTIPYRPKTKPEKRPSHAPVGRGNSVVVGRR